MILVMKPTTDISETDYKVLDISWISDYPDEREYLLFDHKMEIETWILSSDYDEHYHYYHNTLTKNKILKAPIGHRSYNKQIKIPKQLTNLKSLISQNDINSDENINHIVDFHIKRLSRQERIDLFIWLYNFAKDYKTANNRRPPRFDQSINANIHRIIQKIDEIIVSPNIVIKAIKQLTRESGEDISVDYVRNILYAYFILDDSNI